MEGQRKVHGNVTVIHAKISGGSLRHRISCGCHLIVDTFIRSNYDHTLDLKEGA